MKEWTNKKLWDTLKKEILIKARRYKCGKRVILFYFLPIYF